MSEVLLGELRAWDVFVDGGASFGWFSALAVHALGGRGQVVAVEAGKERARVLEDDLERAGAPATVINAALGAAPGRAVLRAAGSGTEEYQRTIAPGTDAEPAAEAESVEVVTLDSLALPSVDVLKLDIEGAELDALRGARDTLTRLRPRLLLIEVLESNLRRFGQTPAELAAFLDSVNYTRDEIIAGIGDENPMWLCRPRQATAD